jgi:hypothetical protein
MKKKKQKSPEYIELTPFVIEKARLTMVYKIVNGLNGLETDNLRTMDAVKLWAIGDLVFQLKILLNNGICVNKI